MIKSKVKTSDSNPQQIKNFQKKIKGKEKAYVTIGVHPDAGTYGDGTSVVEVALWNEYGTSTIPERSFIRSAIDQNTKLIEAWRLEMIENILTKDWSVKQALEAIGFRVQTLIQNKIKSNVPPPNAPSTLAQKRRDGTGSNTLINTGLLLRSIGYKVYGA